MKYMENKQTAVEWLELVYHSQQGYLSERDFKEAKAMEKEQMISFAYTQIQYIQSDIGDLIYTKIPEEIYSETYNK